MAENEEEVKSLLISVKEESDQAGLKFDIQKTKIMASGPSTLWQINREKWKQWKILYSWAPKSLQMMIAAMKSKDVPLKEAVTNLDNVLKSRDITLSTKVHIVKSMVFPVVMYGCKSWTM